MILVKSWSHFFKRFFCRKKTWIFLVLWLIIVFFLFFNTKRWFFNTRIYFIRDSAGLGHDVVVFGPTITSVNDFFACILPNLIWLPLLVWTFVFLPLSWLFWGLIDELAQKTEKDGTDLFFLSTEIPTSRKQIFYGKVSFLTSSLIGLHLILFALPLSLLLWKLNWFSNFTGMQTLLFLGWSFLITPLFLLFPLIVLLFSLDSLRSAWYTTLKLFGRFSIIIYYFFILLTDQKGELSKKVLEQFKKLKEWQENHYLLTSLTIIGIIIALSSLTLNLAYKKYQKKDLS